MAKNKRKMNRRSFLKTTAIMAAPLIVPRHVLGGPGQVAPSDTFGGALIGCGDRGPSLVGSLGPGVKMLARCDVKFKGWLNITDNTLASLRREEEMPEALLSKLKFLKDKEFETGDKLSRALEDVLTKSEAELWRQTVLNHARVNNIADDKTIYTDFRKVLERKDIDVVAIATPPGWHALISIAAMEAGKDVLCEKPMCRFIAEGRAVAEAEKRYNRIFQIGTYGRFSANRRIRKIFESGLLKQCDTVMVQQGGLKVKAWSGKVSYKVEPVPKNLDWDMYCGPTPLRPFQRHRFGGGFRGYWDYDGGGLGDMAHHYLDGLCYQYGRDFTSPRADAEDAIEVTPYAPPMHPECSMVWGWCELKYADGFTLVFTSDEWGPKYGGPQPKNIGESDIRKMLSEEDQKKLDAMPDPPPPLKFEDAIRQRKPAGGNAAASHRVATIYHLMNIAMRCGRQIRFDPVKDEVVGDEEANRLAQQPMRAPWRL